jgi:hypothetical protein
MWATYRQTGVSDEGPFAYVFPPMVLTRHLQQACDSSILSLSIRVRLCFPDFEPLLKFYGYSDLDVPVVRGHDRRITRYISQWTYEQLDEDERPMYAGIRYLSRLNSDWECWAVFDHVAIEELTRHAILPQDEALTRIAKLYGLTVY